MVGFERYEIIQKLKDDEIGETFAARWAEREEPVALKIFRPRGRPKALIARLMGQLEGCRRVREFCLVKHLDVGRSPDGGLYLATQLLQGENLAERLSRSGPLAPAALIRLVLPLCGLIERLREQGFYYPELRACDVFLPAGASPCESLLLDAGRAWLGDCGVFRAPECQPGESGGRRADVFALGVLMYEALEGRPPFLEDAADPWRRRADRSLSSLHGTSLALSGIIDRCLSRNPRERFESPTELAEALAEGFPPSDISPEVSAADEVADGVKLGDCLGSYRLERQLGAGSMGRVFLARHVRLGRTAAIKVLRRDYAQSPRFVERFFQEAKAVNRINHQHIVEVLDFVEERLDDGPRVYCVMEMLAGESLAELLAREPISVHRTINIARQLCAGLQAAHQLGVVHRDIKPDNIFITVRQGVPDFVKILDFGVAKMLSPAGGEGLNRSLEAVIVGTPAYMAPEQAAGFAADARSDVYSVGAVCYQMLAGRVPFDGATLGQLMAKVIAHPAPPLGLRSVAGEDIPGPLAALVMSCLEKDPKRRPESMDKLAEGLSAFAPAGSFAPRRLRKLTPLRVSVGAVALIILAALIRHPDGLATETPARTAAPPTGSTSQPPGVEARAADAQVVNVKIASRPPGARVFRADSGAELGYTPLAKPFSSAERDVVLRLELPGHAPIERTINPADRPSVEVNMPRLKRDKKADVWRGFTDRIGQDGLINPYE